MESCIPLLFSSLLLGPFRGMTRSVFTKGLKHFKAISATEKLESSHVRLEKTFRISLLIFVN